jgi:hypothetical protein
MAGLNLPVGIAAIRAGATDHLKYQRPIRSQQRHRQTANDAGSARTITNPMESIAAIRPASVVVRIRASLAIWRWAIHLKRILTLFEKRLCRHDYG